MKKLAMFLIVLIVLSVSLVPVVSLAEDKMPMPDLSNPELKLHQDRFFVNFCDQENKLRPIYLEVYNESALEKQLYAYFESETAEKPSVIAVEADSVIIYADFNGDGIVDVSGAPGDPEIGDWSCDTLYNLRSSK